MSFSKVAAGGKRAFPKDDGKSIARSARGAELRNQRERTDLRVSQNNHNNERKQTNNGLKFSQLCFFLLFFFKPLSLCARRPLQTALGGSEQESSSRQLPVGFGAVGTASGSGLGPLLLHGRGIVLVHGENYFLEWGGGGAGTHQRELPTHLPPHPPTRLYTQYIHTHTRPRGQRACHCSASNRKAVSWKQQKPNHSHFRKTDPPVFCWVVSLFLRS